MNSQLIIFIAIAIFVGWFAFGMIFNLRKGDATLKWMQAGLVQIGERTSFRWLGTSVAELGIAKAKRPFQKMTTLLVLKPRDVFWMTILASLQRRSDVVIFRAVLNSTPLLDLELADPKTWSGSAALRQVAERGWESTDYHGLRLMAPKGLIGLASKTIDSLAEPMQALAPRYVRFSLRKSAPNFEVHLPFPDIRTADAHDYFKSLCDLGRSVSERT